MARYMGEVKGSGRTSASRLGHKTIQGHIRGWNVGIEVYISPDTNDEDKIEVYLTSGSNGEKKSILLGRYTERDIV
jgi:hypothetical protein